MRRRTREVRYRIQVGSTAISISRELSDLVEPLSFGDPVDVVYNPLVHARRSHEDYLQRYARSGVRALLLGSEPRPLGHGPDGSAIR